MADSVSDACREAAQLGRAGGHENLKAAWKIINKLLTEAPKSVPALVTGSFLMYKLENFPVAYHFALAATQIWPNNDATWTNLGHAASAMWLPEEAERAYKRGLQCKNQTQERETLLLNLCALYLDNGRFSEGEDIARKILASNPAHVGARTNLGFCQLAKGDWAEGWKGYHGSIGEDWRPRVQYNDEPEWDGTPGKVVALYGDQGLGDEISFASMVPDAKAVCSKLILDCDDRLEGLFKRSFPGVRVYGTRRNKSGKWDKDDWNVEGSLPLGQIGEFFRTSEDSFPGKPYLVPCPDRVRMWDGLWNPRKPVIGIAWSGGIPKTNSRNRRVGLNEFLPVFHQIDAQYVCLQYKDAAEEIAAFHVKHPEVNLKQYPWGTLTSDYDDTAALIASCDYVLCIQTAVAHTAAALGVPVSVLIPVATTWRYGSTKQSIPWYESLRIIRQAKHGSWRCEIERAGSEIATYLGRVPHRARETARDDELRRDEPALCANRLADHKPNGCHAPS